MEELLEIRQRNHNLLLVKLTAIKDYPEVLESYQEIAECIECARMYPEAFNPNVAEGESPTNLSNEKQLELLKENR